MTNPALSILVCSYNNSGQLRHCLKAIKEAEHKSYELIVVDDGSMDDSHEVAMQYSDKAYKIPLNQGRSFARNVAARLAKGQILVFIDSDVLIRKHSLSLIHTRFEQRKDISALTGLLSKEHFNKGFFSQYKNLYMNYIFSKLPEQVSFLYGSVHAVLSESFLPFGDVVKVADDTALGQTLNARGKKIAFARDLEVIHLKKYSLPGIIKNDFIIPYDMGIIFVKFKVWKQFGKFNCGVIHSPREQLAGLLLAFIILVQAAIAVRYSFLLLYLPASVIPWIFVNGNFFNFLYRQRGPAFALKAVLFTFFDQLIMLSGACTGIAMGCLFRQGAGRYNASVSRSPRQ
jgi:glycosyltransferase involved in cell wall biosynthesis